MNGMKPKFLEDETMNENYYAPPNPYQSAPPCNVNLLELSRYANQVGKKLADLSKEEVKRFTL